VENLHKLALSFKKARHIMIILLEVLSLSDKKQFGRFRLFFSIAILSDVKTPSTSESIIGPSIRQV
jgi:hypothetical protein